MLAIVKEQLKFNVLNNNKNVPETERAKKIKAHP